MSIMAGETSALESYRTFGDQSDFKDVRAQNFPRTVFFKLWLQVENDKIRLKT